MRKISILYKPILGLAYMCGIFDAASQQVKLERKNFLNDFVFKGNHIQFSYSTLANFKAGLNRKSGDHPVSTNMAPGFLISFKYSVNFNNEYSFITGPETMILGRNFITSFNKNDFSPPLTKNYELRGANSYLGTLVISLPLLLEKRWIYAKTKFFIVNTGLRLNVSTGADFDVFSILLLNTNNGFYNAGEVDVYANNDAKPWVSFPVNASHSWLLKNNNLLQLSICSNISFTKYVNGTYQIVIPNKPLTSGQYSSTGTFVGLSFIYVFTNANYRIRKAYEKNG